MSIEEIVFVVIIAILIAIFLILKFLPQIDNIVKFFLGIFGLDNSSIPQGSL